MFTKGCRVCGKSFLNDTQERWLKDHIKDAAVLDHVISHCPECRAQGHGLVRR